MRNICYSRSLSSLKERKTLPRLRTNPWNHSLLRKSAKKPSKKRPAPNEKPVPFQKEINEILELEKLLRAEILKLLSMEGTFHKIKENLSGKKRRLEAGFGRDFFESVLLPSLTGEKAPQWLDLLEFGQMSEEELERPLVDLFSQVFMGGDKIPNWEHFNWPILFELFINALTDLVFSSQRGKMFTRLNGLFVEAKKLRTRLKYESAQDSLKLKKNLSQIDFIKRRIQYWIQQMKTLSSK